MTLACLELRMQTRIYIAEWIDAIPGATRAGAAKAAEHDVSYIANLKAGRKENPSAQTMRAWAHYLGITVDDLFRPPPTVRGVSAAALEALARRPLK